MVPRNTAQCAPKKLGFSAMVSKRPSSSFNSRVSLNSYFGFSFGKLNCKRSFVVRAEAENVENEEVIEETEAEAENVEDEEEIEEGEAEVEAKVEVEAVETEEKPPRKPRIKLGDIMGVHQLLEFFNHFGILFLVIF